MGFTNFQKPVIQMGQEGSFSAGPIGAGISPGPGFNGPADLNPNFPAFQTPNPNYAFPVQEVPVPVAVSATPSQIPTWGIVAGSVAAGALLTYLLTKKN